MGWPLYKCPIIWWECDTDLATYNVLACVQGSSLRGRSSFRQLRWEDIIRNHKIIGEWDAYPSAPGL